MTQSYARSPTTVQLNSYGPTLIPDTFPIEYAQIHDSTSCSDFYCRSTSTPLLRDETCSTRIRS
ncbi:hypothetical protein J6590_030134, partial [Homalodisca vitripennis]